MTYSGADRLRQLGAIMLAADSLDRALNDLSRTELHALGDLTGATIAPNTSTADLQVRVRRRLLKLKGANGNPQPDDGLKATASDRGSLPSYAKSVGTVVQPVHSVVAPSNSTGADRTG